MPKTVLKPAKVAAPKAAKKLVGTGPKEPREKLTEGPYNFLLARLRRVTAGHFSAGDKEKKSVLTTNLRRLTTFAGVKKAVVEEAELTDSEGFDKFLSEVFFVPYADKEEK